MQSRKQILVIPRLGRLDQILRDLDPELAPLMSRNAWKKLFDLGMIRSKSGLELRAQDRLPPGTSISLEFPSQNLGLLPEFLATFTPLYCDPKDQWLCFNKIAGMPSYPLFPWTGGCFANYVSGYLEQTRILTAPEFAALGPLPKLEGGLVQRLDTHTSGALIVALNQSEKSKWRQLFQEHQIEKKYYAAVVGEWKTGPLQRKFSFFQTRPEKVCVEGAQPDSNAFGLVERKISKIKSAEFFLDCVQKNANYSLMHIATRGGIRHQVRALLASLGFPLVGDSLYQNPEARRSSPASIIGHLLHASEIRSLHDKTIPVLHAPFPQSFNFHLQSLGLY